MRIARHSRLMAVIVLAIFIATAGCRTTTLATTWKDPTVRSIAFTNVVAVVLNSSPAERRAQEDALTAHVKRAAVTPSYTFIPDDLLKEPAKAKQRIIEGKYDGAMVLKLVDTRQETTYVPPSTSTWNDGWALGYSGYNDADSHPSYDVMPGYTATDTFVRAEISLYEVPSGRLLWSGASETMNPTDARALATDVLKAAAAELKKQGLIR